MIKTVLFKSQRIIIGQGSLLKKPVLLKHKEITTKPLKVDEEITYIISSQGKN